MKYAFFYEITVLNSPSISQVITFFANQAVMNPFSENTALLNLRFFLVIWIKRLFTISGVVGIINHITARGEDIDSYNHSLTEL